MTLARFFHDHEFSTNSNLFYKKFLGKKYQDLLLYVFEEEAGGPIKELQKDHLSGITTVSSRFSQRQLFSIKISLGIQKDLFLNEHFLFDQICTNPQIFDYTDKEMRIIYDIVLGASGRL